MSADEAAEAFYGLSATLANGQTFRMDSLRGKVVVVVNIASHCGFTPQLASLQTLATRHADDGLVVLGFPSNEFGGQSPLGSKIEGFCQKNYGVTFPVFAEVTVNGDDAHPLFALLKARQRGTFWQQRVMWNFEKFVIDRDGTVVARHSSLTTPDVGALLAKH